MNDIVLKMGRDTDKELGKVSWINTDPERRGSLCNFECPRCEASNTITIPEYGNVYSFFNCESCSGKLFLYSFKVGYGLDSEDNLAVCTKIIRRFFDVMQPYEDFLDPRDDPEYDSIAERLLPKYAYQQITAKIAQKRNHAILKMFKTTNSEEILNLW